MNKLKAQIKELRKNKGFTLIELIVVIAVLGILVLLAAPKFLGYTSDAREVQLKNDMRVLENQIISEQVRGKALSNFSLLSTSEIEEFEQSGKVLNNKGELVSDLGDNVYFVEDNKSKLEGTFIYSEDLGEVLYYSESNVEKEVILEDKYNWSNEEWSGYYNASKDLDGYFTYSGNKKEVVLTEQIDGVQLNGYTRMFYNNKGITKVSGDKNENITNADEMFKGFESDYLDLTELDLTTVTQANNIFNGAKLGTLDLRGFRLSSDEDTQAQGFIARATIDTLILDTELLTGNAIGPELNLYEPASNSIIGTLDLTHVDLDRVKAEAFHYGLLINIIMESESIDKILVQTEDDKEKLWEFLVESQGEFIDKEIIESKQ